MKLKLMKIFVSVLVLILVSGVAVVSAADTPNSGQSRLQQGIVQCRQGAQTALEAVSEMTGLSIDKIREQRQEGKSLQSIAESKGVSEEALTDKILAERKSVIDQLKADGKITDEQYQNCINNMESRIKANLERTTTGPMMGKGNGQQANQSTCQGKGCGNGGMQSRLQQNCQMHSTNNN